MKAPNGKPTNLTEDQWITVRTETFKEWFGDWEKGGEPTSRGSYAEGSSHGSSVLSPRSQVLPSPLNNTPESEKSQVGLLDENMDAFASGSPVRFASWNTRLVRYIF